LEIETGEELLVDALEIETESPELLQTTSGG
jgi:hypothetical protein